MIFLLLLAFLTLGNPSFVSAEEAIRFGGDFKKYEKVLVEKVVSADYFFL